MKLASSRTVTTKTRTDVDYSLQVSKIIANDSDKPSASLQTPTGDATAVFPRQAFFIQPSRNKLYVHLI